MCYIGFLLTSLSDFDKLSDNFKLKWILVYGHVLKQRINK